MLATVLTKILYFEIPTAKPTLIKGDLKEISEGVFQAKAQYIHKGKEVLRIDGIKVSKDEGKDHIGTINKMVNLDKGDVLDVEYTIHVEEI